MGIWDEDHGNSEVPMFTESTLAGLVLYQFVWPSSATLWWLWVTLAFIGTLMLLVAVAFAIYGVTHCPSPRLPCVKEALKRARRQLSEGKITRKDYKRIRHHLRTG